MWPEICREDATVTCDFCRLEPQTRRLEHGEWVHVWGCGDGIEYVATCTAEAVYDTGIQALGETP